MEEEFGEQRIRQQCRNEIMIVSATAYAGDGSKKPWKASRAGLNAQKRKLSKNPCLKEDTEEQRRSESPVPVSDNGNNPVEPGRAI